MMQKQALQTSLASSFRADGYWVPMPGPQTLAVALSRDKRYREILFGGARGPGKTDASIAILGDRFGDKRARQLVIRRNAEDLSDFEDRANLAYKAMGAKLRRKPMTISGKNTGRILGGHLKDDDAYTKYQGHEYCRINIEELTQIPRESMYTKLISSARSKYPDLFPQVFNTTNPGGIGMAWVKKRFVTPDPAKTIRVKHEYHWIDKYGNEQVTHWQTIIEKETGLWRAYIPATIDSNSILIENDPDYVRQLEAIKDSDPELYQAWRHGSWDIQFGAVFDDFRASLHTFTKFYDWGIDQKHFEGSFKICGMDWGYNDECVLLWATFDTITEQEERAFVYREKHDNHKHPRWWAEEFVKIQREDPVDILALPHDAFSHLGGNKPINEVFKEALEVLPPDSRPKIERADKLSKDIKKSAVNSLHNMFAPSSDGHPAILIHRTCDYLIETLPTIVYAKESGGEELDKDNVDHALDALFYTLLTANKVRGKLLNKSELRAKKRDSFIAGTGVTYEELGLDPTTLIKNATKKQGDWRTM
ncbi:terminase large subunit [TM7 phage DolZOral124_53_65]|nr:terminase large subunit [TM7 phage DolZOral124_53_65]